MAIKSTEIRDRLYTNLDRIPFSGEVTVRTEDVTESPSGTIADTSIIDWIAAAERRIASECSAIFLGSLRQTFENDVLSNLDTSTVVRPMPGTVHRQYGGTYYPCSYRELAEHNYLEESGREASNLKPAWTWDEEEITIYPVAPVNVKLDYIRVPVKLSSIADNQTLALSDCMMGPVVAYCTAMAHRQLENYELERVWMEWFNRLVAKFKLTWRIGTPRDYQSRSRIPEIEVRTE